MPPEATPSRVAALDGLRGYAALAVVFFHAILHIDESQVGRVLEPAFSQVGRAEWDVKAALAVFNGAAAVQLFYVLSGAVLVRSLLRTPMGAADVLAFVLRRALRLLPALAACLALMWLLSAVHAGVGAEGYPKVEPAAALANALLIDTRVHGPSTTVQVEALATPFLIVAAWLIARTGLVAAWVAAALAVCALSMPALVFHWPNLHANLGAFMFGALVAQPALKPAFIGLGARSVLVLLLLGLGLRALVDLNALPGLVAQWLLLGGVVGALMHGPAGHAVHRFLCAGPSQWLGRISYSFYLLCVPVQFLIWFSPALSFLGLDAHPLRDGLLAGALAALVTLPLAHLSYRWIEHPGIRLGERITAWLSRGRRAQVAGGAA